ncbi:MAG: class I SAM-dependent methyltransferase [Rhizobiaceae bacterium]|nr:class I SAM-dependent methyltransferase [Rhizobiaceae bacterium]MCV0408560.1 class I SAM-dependent methyltransferase [Rhizobiaceae bacterium]
MTRLKQRIVQLIEAEGPIGVDRYMAICLFDSQDGYYTTREPFGRSGDFVTAPEISQMFGEIVAVWLAEAWQAIGQPRPVTLAEIGPGRGTLAADITRTLAKVAPDFLNAAHLTLIEASPRLRTIQQERLAHIDRIAWLERVDQLAKQPLLLVGNEIFDALPVRQFVRTPEGWRERMVDVAEGELRFVAGSQTIPDRFMPAHARSAAKGSVWESAPAREALMAEIASHISLHGGAGLFFDYGHIEPGFGDTLQAVRRHAHDAVFAHPGEADLTSHVDFASLAAAARAGGLTAQMMTQGHFLLGMGLLERAGSLGARADETIREDIRGAVERLAGPDQMGTLFKAMAVLPSGRELAPFAPSD